MAIKVSKKDMKETYFLLGASYCALTDLLGNFGTQLYSAGVYGWSCDYYIIEDGNRRAVISTGYSPVYDVMLSRDICDFLNDLANRTMHSESDLSYNDKVQLLKKKALDILLPIIRAELDARNKGAGK